ncbi:Muniscin C-terminal mu homology domain-containing protein [Syncephalis plumigaleata]|nr:Muniscin C-terminal mu homology domain-containing protein [Syncephalis plumigaleata]
MATDASTLLLRYETLDRVRLNNLKESITRLQSLQSDAARTYTELLDRTLAIAFDFDPEEDIARVCSSSVGTSINGSSYRGGVYMNDTIGRSSVSVQRSTLSLPNGTSPRISTSNDSIPAHSKSATPSRVDLRHDTQVANKTSEEVDLTISVNGSTTELDTHSSATTSNNPIVVTMNGTNNNSNEEEDNSILSTTVDTTITSVTTVSTPYPEPSHTITSSNSSHLNDSPKIAHASLDCPAHSTTDSDTDITSSQSDVNGHDKTLNEPSVIVNTTKLLPTRLNLSAVRSTSTHEQSTSSSPVDTPDSPRLSATNVSSGGHSPLKTERSLGLQRRITRRSSTRDPETRRASAAVDPSKFQQVARSLSLEVTGKKSSSLAPVFQPVSGSSSPLSQQEPIIYVAEPEQTEEETFDTSISMSSLNPPTSPNSLSKRNPFATSVDSVSVLNHESANRNQYNPFAPSIAIQPATPSLVPTTVISSSKPSIQLTMNETIHAICQSTGLPMKTVIHGELHARPTMNDDEEDDGASTGQACILVLSAPSYSDNSEASLHELKILNTDATLSSVNLQEPVSLVCPLTREATTTSAIATWQVHSTGLQETPLLVQAAWRIETNGISLAIQYRRNPHCTRLSNATLKNLSFLLPLHELGSSSNGDGDSNNVIQVQARPSGIWDEVQSKLLWQIDEDMTSSDHTPRRILARLVTRTALDEQATLPPIAVRFDTSYTTLNEDSITSMIGPLGISNILVQTEDANITSAHIQINSGKYISMP